MQWEVTRVSCETDSILPDGWEPFAVASNELWLRRPVLSAVVKRLPTGILSEEEVADRQRASRMRQDQERAKP